MNLEIEIKLRLPEDLRAIRQILRRRGFRVAKRRVHESNILFDTATRELRKHGRLLRVRRAGRRSLVTYKGRSERSQYKKRPEIETDFADSAAMEGIFAQLGYHPVFRYEKFRTEYHKGSDHGKVLLDETPVGNFLEIEGSVRWIDHTARLLGFSRADYVNRSYGYLYLAYCSERRITPKDMLFKSRRRQK